MRFLVLGYDSSDDQAAARRETAREQHLTGSKRRYAAGEWFDSGALLNDTGNMIGSFIVCDYPTREELERRWLNAEPYVIGGVWQRIEIHPIKLSPRACSAKRCLDEA